MSGCLLALLLAASPAATQQWVRNYVATNSNPGGVDAEWVANYVKTCGVATTTVKSADYSTNTVEGVLNSFALARLRSRASCTNEAFVSSSAVTNINSLAFVPVGGDVWTNAPSGSYLVFAENRTSMFWNGTEFYRVGGGVTNSVTLRSDGNDSVYIRRVMVDDGKRDRAKGE